MGMNITFNSKHWSYWLPWLLLALITILPDIALGQSKTLKTCQTLNISLGKEVVILVDAIIAPSTADDSSSELQSIGKSFSEAIKLAFRACRNQAFTVTDTDTVQESLTRSGFTPQQIKSISLFDANVLSKAQTTYILTSSLKMTKNVGFIRASLTRLGPDGIIQNGVSRPLKPILTSIDQLLGGADNLASAAIQTISMDRRTDRQIKLAPSRIEVGCFSFRKNESQKLLSSRLRALVEEELTEHLRDTLEESYFYVQEILRRDKACPTTELKNSARTFAADADIVVFGSLYQWDRSDEKSIAVSPQVYIKSVNQTFPLAHSLGTGNTNLAISSLVQDSGRIVTTFLKGALSTSGLPRSLELTTAYLGVLQESSKIEDLILRAETLYHHNTGELYLGASLLERALSMIREEKTALTTSNREKQRGAVDSPRYIKLSDLEGIVLSHLGSISLLNGETSLARQQLEEAEQLAPDNPEIHLKLGDLFIRIGNYQSANVQLKRALKLQPDRSVRQLLGNLHLKYGEYSSARNQFQKILALDPEDKEAKEGLLNSWIYESEEVFDTRCDRKNTQTALEQVIKLDPSKNWKILELGEIYLTRGEFGKLNDLLNSWKPSNIQDNAEEALLTFVAKYFFLVAGLLQSQPDQILLQELEVQAATIYLQNKWEFYLLKAHIEQTIPESAPLRKEILLLADKLNTTHPEDIKKRYTDHPCLKTPPRA